MDAGVSEIISKQPPAPSGPVVNGHIPQHLDQNDINTASSSNLPGNEPFAANSNSFSFNITLNTRNSEPTATAENMASLENEVTLGVGELPVLPFALPDIDGSLLDRGFCNLSGNQLEECDVDDSGGSGFSFDSSVFNDDLVNSALWSIGGTTLLSNLDGDAPGQQEEANFDALSGSDSGTNLIISPDDVSGQTATLNSQGDLVMPLNNNSGIPPVDGTRQPIPPDNSNGPATPPDENSGVSVNMPPDIQVAPHVGVYCVEEEDRFDDSFSNQNPFLDSSGLPIDPFLDMARNRALSTITEGCEEEEESRFGRSGNFQPTSLDKVLNAFADAHEFVRLNSDPTEGQPWKERNGWVGFDTSTEMVKSSDWSNENAATEDSRAMPTNVENVGGDGRLEETVSSPVSDGNQVGVSPETVEVGLTKPMGESWQSVSSEDDVINVGGKTPSPGNQQQQQQQQQHDNSAATVDNFNPSNAQFSTSNVNTESPRTQNRAPSPAGSDDSDAYMRLADFHISPLSSEAPPTALNDSKVVAVSTNASVAEATSSQPSQKVTSSDHQSEGNAPSVSQNISESTGPLQSVNVAQSDSNSTGTGVESAVVVGAGAVVTAAAVVSVTASNGMQESSESTNVVSGDANRRDDTTNTPARASSSKLEADSESSALSPSDQPPAQVSSSENDQSSSSLDTGDRSATTSNLDSCPRESSLDSSNLDAGLRRKKQNPSTPPSQRRSHPATNLPILSPLSPEHGGTELNEQYEFLRRTLSHSQRRYSERRKQRGGQGGQEGTGAGGRRYTNVNLSRDPEARKKQTVGQLRDLLRKSEAQQQQVTHNPEGHEAHVDHHGRTYYMDHDTRTIAYNGGDRGGRGAEERGETEVGGSPARRNPREIQTRREMLNRRYQSLQRSFRRPNEDRPRRNQRFGTSSSVRTAEVDNMSLTLTPQEAEAMMRSQASNRSTGSGRSLLSRGSRTSASVTERSLTRKQRSGSGSKSRWIFGRKSSKTISQQGMASGDDDFLPVFSPTGEGETRFPQAAPPTVGDEGMRAQGEEPSSTPSMLGVTTEGQRLASQSSITSVESQTPLIPPSSDSDTNSRTARVGEAAAVSVAAAAASTTSDNEQELTPSTPPADGESVQSPRAESTTSDQQPLIGVIVTSPQDSVTEVVPSSIETEQRREEVTQENSGGGAESEGVEAVPNASPAIGELGRQSTIVRASGLSSDDREAATRARQRARTRSQLGEGRNRRNTDELTNEEALDPSRRSRVLIGTTTEQLAAAAVVSSPRQGEDQTSSSDVAATAEPRVRGGKEKEAAEEAAPKKKSRSSRRSQKVANRGLYVSPGLRFIARKDLYTFLTSAGQAGEEFFANRALMELVQRIRADNSLFEKYQHSRHLVTTLNQFADVKADLPSGWEKKLNKEGKVFFIDHEHELTTFIDPRLPLPNQQFTYTPVQSTVPRRVSYDDTGLRPHHTTTVRHSQSLDSDMAMATPTPTNTAATPTTTNQGNSLAPPSSSSSSPSRASTGSESSVVGGDGGARARLASESVAPPTYEEQVVAFFRQAEIVSIISGRYHRGVRPQLRDIIAGIRMEGTTALERIQMSGSIATYELAIVLSLFEEEISRMNPQVTTAQPLPPPTSGVVSPPPSAASPRTPSTPGTPVTPVSPGKSVNVAALSTLQRQKLDFATKLQNFKIMMTRVGFSQGSRLKFNIRRDHLLEDSYEHVMKSNLKHLQMKRLNISFKGEEGLDYGGPSREFFFLLSREIFNPYYGLFEYSANDTYTVQISPTSSFIHNNMEWFRFAGRIVGLVIAQGFLLDVFFTRTVYKSLLCKPPHLKDLEALEPAFYNSLLWIQENDPEPLDLTFTVEEEAFGQVNSHDLKDGGDDILVTEENKHEYIDLMLRWRLDRGVAKQMESFKKGFCEVMPVNLLYNFDAQELEFLTAGTLEIDVDDWRAHTEYRNGYHAAHQVVMWFWQAVEMFDNEQRLRLLQFVTGTSSVPFEGFKALRGSNGPKRFTIDFFNDVNAFPRTHTCFNRIDLPPYPSFEVLYEKLRFAVEEGGGFGIE